jgi:large subunit ribosomal protein L22
MVEAAVTFNASHRFARISPQKARLVMDTIRGDSVEKALNKLLYSQRRASPMIRKVVRSALANATQKAGLQEEELVVWRAAVDDGPTMKRWRPRAQGRAYPRLRRSCHLSVILKQVVGKGGDSKGGSGKAKDASSSQPPGTEGIAPGEAGSAEAAASTTAAKATAPKATEPKRKGASKAPAKGKKQAKKPSSPPAASDRVADHGAGEGTES